MNLVLLITNQIKTITAHQNAVNSLTAGVGFDVFKLKK